MRVEFKVTEVAGRWRVQRGFTGALTYPSFDAAVMAAETLAKAAAAKGDKGVVRILKDSSPPEIRSFPPEFPRARPSVEYKPERDWRNVRHANPS